MTWRHVTQGACKTWPRWRVGRAGHVPKSTARARACAGYFGSASGRTRRSVSASGVLF